MRPPSPRPPAGRSLLWKTLLIGAVALIALPTFSTNTGALTDQELSSLIRTHLSNFRTQVRGIQENHREGLILIDDVVPEGGFPGAIEDVNVLTSGAVVQYGNAQGAVINSIHTNLQSFNVNPSNVVLFRGLGSCTDEQIRAWFMGAPIAFTDSLRSTVSRQRLSVERFNAQTDRFDRFPTKMSVQLFPKVEDKLIFFTLPAVGPKLSIGGIIGGSYRVPEENDARTTACLFGWAPANTQVNLVAEGLGGPFNFSDTSDSSGEWSACMNGLKQGYYKFTADDGSTTDVKEQGFLLPAISLKF